MVFVYFGHRWLYVKMLYSTSGVSAFLSLNLCYQEVSFHSGSALMAYIELDGTLRILQGCI